MSVLTIRSTEELDSPLLLARKLKDIPKPIVGIVLTHIYLNYPAEFLQLNHDQLQTLISLLEELNIVHLQCQKVRFSSAKLVQGERNISLKDCRSLRTIKMIDCRDTVRSLVRAVCDCPQLQRINTESQRPHYRTNLDIELHLMILKLNSNFSLQHFTLCEVGAALKGGGDSFSGCAAWTQAIVHYTSIICQIVERNAIGLEKCRRAIYQVLLIKRHGKSPLFACLNKDIVKIIAKLVYNSRFTEAWYPSLQIA
jgi:hypothetical protein